MKKFLVLLMVLGVASVASATVTFDYNASEVTPGSTFTLHVNGLKTDLDWIGGIYTADQSQDSGTMDIEGATCYNGVGEVLEGYLTVCIYYPSFDGADLKAGETPSTEPGSADGTWFDLDISVAGDASVNDVQNFKILDFDSAYAEIGEFNITVVPEPMTIALLGLGGLLLRRRRA